MNAFKHSCLYMYLDEYKTIYNYIYIYNHVCMHICICIYICVCVHMHAHVYKGLVIENMVEHICLDKLYR